MNGSGDVQRMLRAGLLDMGYCWEVAVSISNRHKMGQTLFPNETEDALAVLAKIEQESKS